MGKPTVIFSRAIQSKTEMLVIRFSRNLELKEYLKRFDGISWSEKLQQYHIPYSKHVTHTLFQYLREEKYYVDYSALKQKSKNSPKKPPSKRVTIAPAISDEMLNQIEAFRKWMAQKRYSENTIKTYESMLLLFFRFHHPKTCQDVEENDILLFNTNYILANGFSYTYQNQAINAIKLFYNQIEGVNILPKNLQRPRKMKKLPEVLSIEEVKELLSHTPNLKHRTMLSLLYACGLRIGEALNMRVNDIDIVRGFTHIRSGKGFKDRYVPIPRQMCQLLINYLECYDPEQFVFEGQHGGKYSPVSARQILKRSLRSAGILKAVTLHTLRHSHATHLLENGTDIRYIQVLLGHNSPKTTMIYTHVSTTSLDKIKNPFDDFEV